MRQPQQTNWPLVPLGGAEPSPPPVPGTSFPPAPSWCIRPFDPAREGGSRRAACLCEPRLRQVCLRAAGPEGVRWTRNLIGRSCCPPSSPKMINQERPSTNPPTSTHARSIPTRSFSTPLSNRISIHSLSLPDFSPVRRTSTNSAPLRPSPVDRMAERTDGAASAYGGSKPADALTALAEKGE